MNVEPSFFKLIHSQKTIYHYTKVSYAIDSILKHNTLKFSERGNAKDPIESISLDSNINSDWYGDDEEYDLIQEKNLPAAFLLSKKIKDAAKQYGQISFCRNAKGDFDFLNYNGNNFLNKEEKYGFTKPRMWEQYAENYSGVCLVLSKEKIKQENNYKRLFLGNVKYLKYKKLLRKNLDINLNTQNHIGEHNYENLLRKKIKQTLFWKHKDYKGESEYKICANKCFPGYPYLNIKGCLQAIIVSERVSWEDKEMLLKYALDNKVPIIQIKWTFNSIELKDFNKIFDSIERMLSAKTK